MATAKKLPSGSWRVRVYTHTDEDGKKHYKSFTGTEKKEVEKLALNYTPETKADITFGMALDRYIDRRSKVLSPRTIAEYKSMRSRYVPSLMDIPLSNITMDDIQSAINDECLTHSAKTVRNINGLISAVFRTYRPDFVVRTVLPKKEPVNLYIPSDDEIAALIKTIRGERMELPVLLAAFGPMRRGEICALRAENISGNIVHVCENMVLDESNEWIIKTPKSYAGDRYIDYPDFVSELWKGKETGRIVDMNPTMVTKCFEHVLKRAGLPHFRFHDLRHYSASIQHALGVPDAYIMQRGGWGNDATLKQVYRHTMSSRTAMENKKVNRHFSKLHQRTV